jgi:SWI/SNF-related matrix-associated actin-dependent regulator 1 of chromatin subfamily A
MENQITAIDGKFIVTFEYDASVVASVKLITGRQFHKATGGRFGFPYWTIPATSAPEVFEFAHSFGFRMSKQAVEMGIQAKARLEDSSAAEADYEVKGLHGELHPYQKAGIKYAMGCKRCFIGDEPGLGKTMEAIGVMQAAQAFPALVVCPATVKIKWQREVTKWLPGKSAVIAESSELPVGDVVIINWDIISRHVEVTGEGKKARTVPTEEFKSRGFKTVVLDESHYAKNYRAARTKAAKALASVAEYRLALTGTPLLNRPIEFLSQLMILDRLDDVGGFWGFVKRYCDAKQKTIHVGRGVQFVWDFTGNSNTEELNARMRASCYIRREKSAVKKDLPPKTRSIIPVLLSNAKEYNEKLAEMLDKLGSASKAQQLAEIEYQKQLTAKGKLEAVYEWVDSFLESGEKLVIFAHHREIVEAIAQHYSAPMVIGGENKNKKQAAQDSFQNDPNVKVIVCSKAGSEGIDLFAASNVAFVELWWTPSEHTQAEDRLHREGQHSPVTAWYFLAEGTIDEDIFELQETKRKVVDSATQGSKAVTEGNMVDELVKTLLKSGKVAKTGGKRATVRNKPVEKTSTSIAPLDSLEAYGNFIKRSDYVLKAILFLYARQTADEQTAESTHHQNAMGFNGLDAQFGSSLAKQLLANRTLSQKQLVAAEKMLRKYKRQLSVMESNGG